MQILLGLSFLGVTGGECPGEGSAVRSFAGFCGLCHVKCSFWDRDEKYAGMEMPSLFHHQLQLSAVLSFQVLP